MARPASPLVANLLRVREAVERMIAQLESEAELSASDEQRLRRGRRVLRKIASEYLPWARLPGLTESGGDHVSCAGRLDPTAPGTIRGELMSLFSVDGVGEIIARHRQAAGLTVEQVARDVGVSARRFAMYESNKADIPDDRLLAFAHAVGVNPADLSLECLFHAQPELRNTPIGREFRDLAEWVKTLPPDPPKAPAKKAASKKPATRTPPRRRVSR